MAKKYIEREAARKGLFAGEHNLLCWDEIEERIDNIPAADVVEVVRCRECYFRELDGADGPVCTGAMAYSYTPDDWFCAAGKPKDGGQDDV